MPVTYVTGDIAGVVESPVYAIAHEQGHREDRCCRRGTRSTSTTRSAVRHDHYAMKWDGEWHITYEVFRDLGMAFAAVLVLIYVLVVWCSAF